MNTPQTLPADRLIAFAEAAFVDAGMAGEHAHPTAEILVEGDLMGHSTHGLALLPAYLKELADDMMTKQGQPEVISDTGPAAAWNGHYLPGPSLVCRGLEQCCERAARHGTATLVIARSHHIACLAAFLKSVTDRGMMAIVATSSPSNGTVAPFGAVEGIYTPNPIGVGWPTEGDPVLLDVSMSITTNSMVNTLSEQGKRLPHPWLVTADGATTDDPRVISAEPAGALLPMGGLDHGHKGFALGLMIEAMTSGLAGHGRKVAPKRWSANVFLQVLDPAAFGGRAAFATEMAHLGDLCHAARPMPGQDGVRLPGERGLKLRREQLEGGVRLSPEILAKLVEAAPERAREHGLA